MRIRFESARAREQLLTRGYAYTLRAWHVAKPITALAISNGKPIGKVLVKPVAAVHLGSGRAREVLARYVGGSGFNSVDEWLTEFRRLNGGRVIKVAYLYRVELVSTYS